MVPSSSRTTTTTAAAAKLPHWLPRPPMTTVKRARADVVKPASMGDTKRAWVTHSEPARPAAAPAATIAASLRPVTE